MFEAAQMGTEQLEVLVYDTMVYDVSQFADPNADRGVFWDDSAGSLAFFSMPAAGIAFSGTAIALANDLAAVEALASAGVAVRTGSDTWQAQAQLTNTYGGTGQDSSAWTGTAIISSGTWGALAHGNEGDVLSIVSGVPAWSAATGISSLNGETGATQTFSVSNAGLLSLTINSALDDHEFAFAWTDPGADRILFWDDSGSDVGYLIPSDGLHIDTTSLTVLARYGAMDNGYVTAVAAANVLTVEVQTLSGGGDPSSTHPVYITFDTGSGIVRRTISAELKLDVNSTATLGCVANQACAIWVVAFDDSGTIRLGVIKATAFNSAGEMTDQLRMREGTAYSSTAMSTSADSAIVFYTGSAVTAKHIKILAVVEYDSGLSTPGTWTSPSRIRQISAGSPLPGDVVQDLIEIDAAYASTTNTIPIDDTIPQSSEGAQFMSKAIGSMTSCNALYIQHWGNWYPTGTATQVMAVCLFIDSETDARQVQWWQTESAGGYALGASIEYTMCAGATGRSAKIRAGSSASTTAFNGVGARYYGGAMKSFLRLREIRA